MWNTKQKVGKYNMEMYYVGMQKHIFLFTGYS